jgi:hypothetical protein
MNRRLLTLLFLTSTAAMAVQAATPTEELPPPPPIEESGQVIEPEVTIKQDEKGTTYEYRVNGQLTLVRVVPKVGAPYYFVDSDGDGELDIRREGPVDEAVNQWILFRW